MNNNSNLLIQSTIPFLNSTISIDSKKEFYVVALDIFIRYGMMEFAMKIRSIQTIDMCEVLKYSIINGCTDVVRLLILDARVDSSLLMKCNDAIKKACKANYVDMVEILMKDKRVNIFSYIFYQIIRHVCIFGQIEIFKILIEKSKQVPCVHGIPDFAFADNDAIRNACEKGHTEIVKILLKIPNVNPRAKNNYALLRACSNGHVEIVRILIEDGRITDSYNSKAISDGIYYACKHNQVEVLKILLEYRYSKPSEENNRALYIAAVHKHIDIIKMLLQHPQTIKRNLSIDAIIADPKIVQTHKKRNLRDKYYKFKYY
jgi:ankyrin repeat protein